MRKGNQMMGPERLDTRLGPLAWRSTGHGPALVFFGGAFANGELWRDVIAALQDHYRCITVDLPLGAHRWPLLAGADRSAASLARLLPDCLGQLDVDDATVVANDTAGGLLLLSLATGHPALGRIGRLVLTNCESYDQFPPDKLKKATAQARVRPRLVRRMIRLRFQLSHWWPALGRRGMATVTARGLDSERAESMSAPLRRDPRIVGDFVAAVLLIWGDSCRFFPMAHAERLASDFPRATLVPVPGARTWVPVDNPAAVADAIATFVPAQSP
jgi:pimeloyl-ACP methyl ester carboxylesterase